MQSLRRTSSAAFVCTQTHINAAPSTSKTALLRQLFTSSSSITRRSCRPFLFCDPSQHQTVSRPSAFTATHCRHMATASSSDSKPVEEAIAEKAMSIEELKDVALQIKEKMGPVLQQLEADNVIKRIAEYEKQINDPLFWDDADEAQKISQAHGGLISRRDKVLSIESEVASVIELAEMADADAEEDPHGAREILLECKNTIAVVLQSAERLELATVFSEEDDKMDCFVEISAGAGGKESQDFAQMLMKMYLKWGELSNHKVQLTDAQYTESGIKTAVIQLRGENVFGWMKNEQGTHRMVRVSIFGDQPKRQTCFAQVIVMPLPEVGAETSGKNKKGWLVDLKECKIETYRSAGPGGQHANTTDSAVRITHLPTGLMAQSQGERTQHTNKSSAHGVLSARLAGIENKKVTEELRGKRAEAGDNTWGTQIRSYVFNPYQMVKDHRTNHETAQILSLLEGEPELLTPFMEANLAATLAARKAENTKTTKAKDK